MATARPVTSRAALRVIRPALATSVLLFGAVIVFLHRQPGWKALATLPIPVRYAQVVLALVAVVVALSMRRRMAGEADAMKRQSLLIAGWAVGEAPALLGAVIFFLTGETQWYAVGLVAMFVVFQLMPIPREA